SEYSNNTYIIEKFKDRKYLCNLPAPEKNEQIFDTKNVSSPNEIVSHYTGTCFEYVTGDYWNFSICVGVNVTQYHKDIDGIIRGENFFMIGVYESDKLWKNTELITPVEGNKPRYHSQKYTNGSKCHSNMYRSADVQYICSYSAEKATIISQNEDHSCHYTFLVEDKKFCSIPAFQQPLLERVMYITCSPILSKTEYQNYITFKQVQKQNLEEKSNMLETENNEANKLAFDSEEVKKIVDAVFGKISHAHESLFEPQNDLSNVVTKTILESDGSGGKPVLKWRLSYNDEVNFDKILEHADNIREITLSREDFDALSSKKRNILNTEPNSLYNDQIIDSKPRFTLSIVP
ncbi:hypothetical protein MXB_5442, partial [Myxobolus squamalis]